eukprot:2969701-Amphidinium_carterae.1
MSCAALCSTPARTTARDERTSAAGTSAPLPTWRACSEMPEPSTGTAGSRGPPALGGTQSEKGKQDHSAKVAVGSGMLTV